MADTIKLEREKVLYAVKLLAGIARATAKSRKSIASEACQAVADIIAAAKHGSADQQALMDEAAANGFTVGYYVNSVRVQWE